MSTRATVHFEADGKAEAIVYRHGDGYPEGLGQDLQLFFHDVAEQTKDTRFDDPSYLAAKFVVWQAHRYIRDAAMLNFLGIGVMLTDPEDIAYRYHVNCDDHDPNGYPVVSTDKV